MSRARSLPTRRGALALIAGAALPLAGVGPAPAQVGHASAVPAGLRFTRVVVDATGLARRDDVAGAEAVERELTRSLREVFADLLVPRDARGATLVARMSTLSLAQYVGGRSGGGQGNGPDSLEGVGIVTAGGRVLSETPLLATLGPSYSGAWYDPGIDAVRVRTICHQFAYWLRREMGV